MRKAIRNTLSALALTAILSLATMAPAHACFTLMFSFNNAVGRNSYGGLVQIGTNFYGTTSIGGNNGSGTIFKISSTGVYRIIHHFNYSRSGSNSFSGLLKGPNGKLYGTTPLGGLYGYGTIFKCTPAGVLTVIHNFDISEGIYPVCALSQGIAPDCTLYGVCAISGLMGNGTLFSIKPTGAAFTVLHNFAGSDGAYPMGTVVPDAAGNLYGTTFAGGANGVGTIYKISKKGAGFQTIWDFINASGQPCAPSLSGFSVLSGNFLYGTTAYTGPGGDEGPVGDGALYKLNLTTNTMTVLHTLDNSAGDGYYPQGGVCYDAVNNIFYGTCAKGGTTGRGTIWKYDNTADSWLILHSFEDGESDSPYGGVILGTDGLLYGTSVFGGANNDGTIFNHTAVVD